MERAHQGLTRKEMLKLSVLGSAALILPTERIARGGAGDPLRRLPRPFEARLPIPTPLAPRSVPDPLDRTKAADFYRITAKPGVAEILPGLSTPILGYNGRFPGPLIKATKDRTVVLRYGSNLSTLTSLHNHGAYVDGDSDGHPRDLFPDDAVYPNRYKDYVYPNEENGRFQWFHDHAMHTTASTVYRGLAGLYILEDGYEDANNLRLPEGEFDIPLVIQDRLFDSEGGFLYPFGELDHSANGLLGDVVLVNGVPWPRLEVSRRKYRFRILNGSNARAYGLALSTGKPFFQIGTEGGLQHRPVALRRLPISPGERYEVVIDFSGYEIGEKVILENLRLPNNQSDLPSTRQIMRFDVVRGGADDSRVPAVLRPPEDQLDPTHLAPIKPDGTPDPSQASRTRKFVFERHGGFWTINRKIWDEDRIDEKPREGDTEIWEFQNKGGGWIHPTHPHLTNFKIFDRNGRPPAPYETNWKETVFLGPNETVRVLIKWPEVPPGPRPGRFTRRYAIHCHLIEHEDHDMMLQYEVQKA